MEGLLAEPARRPPADFNRCQYCGLTFGSAVARRSHEENSSFCFAQELLGRRPEKKHRTNASAGQEPAGQSGPREQDAQVAEDDDDGDFVYEDFLDDFVPADVEVVLPTEDAESDKEGELCRQDDDSEPVFHSINELILAFQEAGRGKKPLTPAGINRLLRVLNHPDYKHDEVRKALPDAKQVTKKLAEAALQATVEMKDIALPGDPGPLWCAYVPGADAYKLLYSEPEAAEGFYLRPKPKWVKHTMADGTVRQIRVYGEIRRGVWWEKADEAVTKREAAKERPEGSEPPTVYAGPYILHYDKTHLDAMGNYVLAPVYMSLGNYSRAFIGKQRKGYVLVAFLPVPKPEAFANGWTKNSPQYRYKVRYYVNRGLAMFNESLRVAGFQGLICNDPTGEVRKVYPLPFIFAKDLGEQHTVAGVMQHHCATYVVPREAYADLRAARDPGYPARTVKYMQAKRREIRKMPTKEAKAEASRTGVYPRLKCFLEGTAFQHEDWNNPQDVFMGPDELHTIYGGLVSNHFYNILRHCAPKGKQTELLNALDRGLQYAYSTDKPPGLRLPSNKTHFSVSHNCSHRERAGVLQVLACLLANLCKDDKKGDILVEWVNALNRWINITLWNKEPDDLSLEESDRLLFAFQDASEAIAHLRISPKTGEAIKTGWNIPKMYQLSLFKLATIRNGHPDFSNTDRGEQAHELVKAWFHAIGARPGELIPRMVNQWTIKLGVDRLRTNSWFEGKDQVRTRENRSADARAYETGVNTLPFSTSMVVPLQDFTTVPQPRHGMKMSQSRKSLRAWMRHRPPWTPKVEPATLKRDGAAKRQPLSIYYKQLPEQIGFFILREVRGLSDQEVSAYARKVRAEEAAWPAPVDWRVHINYTLHIAPSKNNDRVETHTIRSCPSFQGKPVFNDVLVKSEEGEWCGKILMLFRFKLRRGESKVLGEGLSGKADSPKDVCYSCALVRWYQCIPHFRDASMCSVYRWEQRVSQPHVTVIDVRTITEMIHMLPVAAAVGKDEDRYYKNIWIRKFD